jgi:hypothetical protein
MYTEKLLAITASLLPGCNGTAQHLVPLWAACGPPTKQSKRPAYFYVRFIKMHEWPKVSLYPPVLMQNNTISMTNSQITLVTSDQATTRLTDKNACHYYEIRSRIRGRNFCKSSGYTAVPDTRMSPVLILWDSSNPNYRLPDCKPHWSPLSVPLHHSSHLSGNKWTKGKQAVATSSPVSVQFGATALSRQGDPAPPPCVTLALYKLARWQKHTASYGRSSPYRCGQGGSGRSWRDPQLLRNNKALRQAQALPTAAATMATPTGTTEQRTTTTHRTTQNKLHGNAAARCDVMWWDGMIFRSLIYTEIQSGSAAEREGTRCRISTADAADSESQGWPNTTAQHCHYFLWPALQYKQIYSFDVLHPRWRMLTIFYIKIQSTANYLKKGEKTVGCWLDFYVKYIYTYQLFVINNHARARRPGFISQERRGLSSSPRPNGSNTHPAALPAPALTRRATAS